MDQGQEAAELRGVRIGKYKLVRKLAMGGMAELFLARATAIHGFEKLVVLKRILPQYAQTEDFIRMFLAEAKLAATLHHPNIVQVYDIGEQDGVFFTMEYVRGRDLRQLLRAANQQKVSISLEHAIHIGMSIASGLQHAHTEVGLDGQHLNIVHRDVSPSNVLIAFDGTVKLVDFGIAKASTAEALTQSGTLKGKLPYMSPEQCRGESLDHRSDIFSLGILLWELTTGRRLFSAKNDFSVLQRVAAADVQPPSSIWSGYPPELESIVMRALQLNPDDRYPDASAIHRDLEEFAHQFHLRVSRTRMAALMQQLFSEDVHVSEEDFANPATRIASGFDSMPEESVMHETDNESLSSGPSFGSIETDPKKRAERMVIYGGVGFLALGIIVYVLSQIARPVDDDPVILDESAERPTE